MIKRIHLDGIDNALFLSLSNAFEILIDRGRFSFNYGLIEEMNNILKAPYSIKGEIYVLELERMDDSIVIEISKDTLSINYSHIDGTTIEKSYHTIYLYEYDNSGEDEIKVEEDGDYFIFSEKLSEHIYSVEINDIQIRKKNK